MKSGIVDAARVIDHQAHGECSLVVLSDPHRVRQLGQPDLEAIHGALLQWKQVDIERVDGQVLRIICCPIAQFHGKLQQPSEAVRPLKAGAALSLQV